MSEERSRGSGRRAASTSWWRRALDPLAQHLFPDASIVPMRGCVEDLSFGDGCVFVSGWSFRAGQPVDELRLSFDERELGVLERVERPDVAEVHPHIAEARHSGWRGSFPAPATSGWLHLGIVGSQHGRPRTNLEFDVPRDLEELGPIPAPDLMHRVAHIRQPKLFRLDGLRAASDVLTLLRRHGAPERGQLLDWGCGCGRVLAVLRARLRGWRIAGVDVDAQAIEWCQGTYPEIELATIPFDPPTALAPRRFDAVIGLSVMTHLDRARQRAWLAELQRITAPGALLLLSVHGRMALRLAGSPQVALELRRDGISDGIVDSTLDGVLAEKLYRATFQTERFTRKLWSEYFEVVEWVDGGLGGFQDIVVLRRQRD